MKQTLTKDMFRFQMNQIRPDNFSYEAQGMLFDHLEECDEDMEFDPIAICCDFTEGNFQEVLNELGDETDLETVGLDEQETAQKVADYLSEKTTVLGITSSNFIVYVNF